MEQPTVIAALLGLNVVGITCGGWHSVVWTDQGDVYTFGWNGQGQLGRTDVDTATPVPLDLGGLDGMDGEEEVVKEAKCGSRHTVILTSTFLNSYF